MKRLVIAVVALAISTTISFSQSTGSSTGAPFAPKTSQLSKYLQLSSYQYDQVADITDYFVEMQLRSIQGGDQYGSKRMYQAVYGNLKLMKGVLTEGQYKMYVKVLNVTNNNKKVLNVPGATHNYLADLADGIDWDDPAFLAGKE